MRPLIALPLLLFTSLVYPQETQPTQDKTQVEQTQPAKKVDSGKPITQEQSITKAEQRDSYDASKDRLYRIYLVFTIVGVLAGIGGIIAIYNQTEATKEATLQTARSAKATEDAATAARTNSQSIINSERPWMFIDIAVEPVDQFPGRAPFNVSFHVSFRNWGKSPAEVVSFENHVQCFTSTEEMPSTPLYIMEGRIDVHSRMVPQGEQWRDQALSYFHGRDHVTPEDWQEIQATRKLLVYYGRLQYRDLIEDARSIHAVEQFGPLHNTCFCYFWSPLRNKFFMDGYPKYNNHTS